jgi:uncharacterized protein
MKCPNCKIDMKQCSLKAEASDSGSGVSVDQCPVCGGVWFDHNELYRFTTIPDDLLEVDRELLGKPVPVQKDMHCPKCGTPLTEYNDPIFKNMVVFMLCRNCEGVWLNSKEIMNYAEFRRHFAQDATRQRVLSMYNKPEFIDALRQSPGNGDLTYLPDKIIKTALVLIQLMFGLI